MRLGYWCKFHITMTLSSRVKDIKDLTSTANKMKFSIKEFFIKCEKFTVSCGIFSHLLKKSLTENFNFYAVMVQCRILKRTKLLWVIKLETTRTDYNSPWTNLNKPVAHQEPDKNQPESHNLVDSGCFLVGSWCVLIDSWWVPVVSCFTKRDE